MDYAPRFPSPLLRHQQSCICTPRGRGLLPNSPITSKIPASNPARLPSNIPLRTLPSHHQRQHHPGVDREQTSRLLGPSHGYGHPVDEPGYSESEEDDSSWTDTGDIAEQLADDDPLRERAAQALGDDALAGSLKKKRSHGRSSKRVRYSEPLSSGSSRSASQHIDAIDKEAIQVPNIGNRKASRAERLLAAIMTGGSGSIHGLTGKPLLFVISNASICSGMLIFATVISLRFLYH